MPATAQRTLAILVLIGALGLGTWLRTSRLDQRAMHTDEAIQADRLGTLLEGKGFDYNPKDGHGPGLLYLSAPIAWMAGATKYTELDETIVRLAPAVSGILLIAAAALFWGTIGAAGVAVAALLTALSPMHVFYSRYFIMELPMVLLLALFLFCLWRYFTKPAASWMVAAGVCGALLHVTKETFAISIAALLLAAAAVALLERWRGRELGGPSTKALLKHGGIGFAVSLFVSAALYSVFFTNPGAIPDSYTTYLNYLERSEGSGHEKPFFYYIRLLAWKPMEIYTWSEILILGLAAVGGASAFLNRERPRGQRIFLRVLALYALFTLLIYSAIAYKTPWSILAFLHAAVLLAGLGFAALSGRTTALGKAVLVAIVGFGCWDLYRQDTAANFDIASNADGDRNPYVYFHTAPRLVSKLVAEVDGELRAIKPDLTVQVFHPETGWPLPWYFRKIEKAGYYPGVTPPVVADVVIADAAYAEELEPLLGNRYMGPNPIDLRDNVPLDYYIERELFFEMVSRRPVTQP